MKKFVQTALVAGLFPSLLGLMACGPSAQTSNVNTSLAPSSVTAQPSGGPTLDSSLFDVPQPAVAAMTGTYDAVATKSDFMGPLLVSMTLGVATGQQPFPYAQINFGGIQFSTWLSRGGYRGQLINGARLYSFVTEKIVRPEISAQPFVLVLILGLQQSYTGSYTFDPTQSLVVIRGCESSEATAFNPNLAPTCASEVQDVSMGGSLSRRNT